MFLVNSKAGLRYDTLLELPQYLCKVIRPNNAQSRLDVCNRVYHALAFQWPCLEYHL